MPSRSSFFRGPVLTAVTLLVVLSAAAGGRAALVRDRSAENNVPRTVFGHIATAWEAEDEAALVALIHPDGLQLTGGRGEERVSHYSPSQAFYFFRNAFKTYRTLIFEFEMMQDASAGTRVHGIAVWKRRRPDSTDIEVVKLVCSLVQQGDTWYLVEINTIR